MLDIRNAAALLLNHDIVAFPTETVYGLGARADSSVAIEKIYALKGRPKTNPLIAHVSSLEMAQTLGEFSDAAKALATAFWPGPLTLVVPAHKTAPLSTRATAGLSTVAIRLPAHPLAQALIQACNVPLVAPSANPSTCISPTSAAHVQKAFPNLPLLDGGPTERGVESTIIDMTTSTPHILRHGSITEEMVAPILNGKLQTHAQTTHSATPQKSPGQQARHYAPAVPIRLNAAAARPREIFLGFGPQDAAHPHNLSPTGDLEEAARTLFATLHALEKEGRPLAIRRIPNAGVGKAINDRLSRAATPPKTER